MKTKLKDILEEPTIWLLVLFLLFSMVHAKGATTSTQRGKAFNQIVTTVPSNTTVVGYILDGAMVRDDDGREAVSLRVHPKYAISLYDESILFCGNVVEQISSGPHHRVKTGEIALTYRTQASRLIQGVPCHALVGVDSIMTTGDLP